MADEVKTSTIEWNHSQDVIFTEESLEEFIRLINRNGINGIKIYSVRNDILANDGNGSKGYHNLKLDNNDGELEFKESRPWSATDDTQLLDKLKSDTYLPCFVLVKTNVPLLGTEWENIKEGRHEYFQAGDIIDIKSGDTVGTIKFIKNGTTAVVTVKGFNNGKFMLSNNATHVFLRGDGEWTNTLQGPLNLQDIQDIALDDITQNGILQIGPGRLNATTSTLYIDNDEIMVTKSIETATLSIQAEGGETLFGDTIYPKGNYEQNLGTDTHHWNGIYGKQLYLSTAADSTANPAIQGAIYVDGVRLALNGIQPHPTTADRTIYFWRGDNCWSNILSSTTETSLVLTNTTLRKGSNTAGWSGTLYFTGAGGTPTTTGSLAWISHQVTTSGNCQLVLSAADNTANSRLTADLLLSYVKGKGSNHSSWDTYTKRLELKEGAISAERVFNAVFNDYAEYRSTIDLEPGRVVIDNDDGSLSCANARLIPGAQVISDTFGHSMGETENAKTPIAVAGRVLVYPYQPRENYHAGMAVCSAPNGTVDIMTREEIREYPDCIIGIVSEIPQYDTWGTTNVEVNGRIWIKVR